jgi:hypothetical protein
MAITKKEISEALEALSILSSQIGNARIREMHRNPLQEFIKKVEKEMDEKIKTGKKT